MDTASDDIALLQDCIEGKKRAWNEFVGRYSRYVYYLINVTAKRHNAHISEEDMSDLHNDFFLCLLEDDYKRLRSYKGDNGCSVRSWLRVIAIRRTIDSLRKRKKMVSLTSTAGDQKELELLDAGPDPFEAMNLKTEELRRSQLGMLTEKLGATDTLLLHMVYIDKLPAGEIARTLRINKGAVYTRKTRLIQRLRDLAKAEGLVDDD